MPARSAAAIAGVPCPATRREGSVAGPMAPSVTMDKIVSLARRRGFVFPSSEIYGGLGSSYDYGHYGVLLKENVKARWLEAMVQERDDIVALDSAIILHPRIWEASGHVGGLHRPARRLPDLQEALPRRPPRRGAVRPSAEQATRARRRTATSPRRASSTSCSRRGSGPSRRRASACSSAPRRRRASSSTSRTSPSSRAASRRSGSRRSGSRSATRSRRGTSSSARSSSSRWRWSSSSRPPTRPTSGTATGSTSGSRGTSATASAPQCLRVRAARGRRALALLERDERHRVPLPDRLVGARGHREPRRHSTSTRTPRRPGTTLEWVDGGSGERYVPAVIEPAAGVNRAMLAFLCDAYDEEVVAERERTVLRLHPEIAPVKVAVLPLDPPRRRDGRARAGAPRGAPPGHGRRARRRRPDRPPLPPPGRDRHAVGADRRRADARRRDGHDPRPRLARAGAHLDRAGARAPARPPCGALEPAARIPKRSPGAAAR